MVQPLHGVDHTVPEIEISHNADPSGIGCPDSEVHALHAFALAGMTTKLMVGVCPSAIQELLFFFFADSTRKAVGIRADVAVPVCKIHANLIFKSLLLGKISCKYRLPFNLIHGMVPALLIDNFHGNRIRMIGRDYLTAFYHMSAQYIKRSAAVSKYKLHHLVSAHNGTHFESQYNHSPR